MGVMLSGYNHNVRHGGLVFHVQSGLTSRESGTILSEVFYQGSIICSRKLKCLEVVDDEILLKKRLQAQHRTAVRDLVQGTFDDAIKSTPGTGKFLLVKDLSKDDSSQGDPSGTLSVEENKVATDKTGSIFTIDAVDLDEWPDWPLTDISIADHLNVPVVPTVHTVAQEHGSTSNVGAAKKPGRSLLMGLLFTVFIGVVFVAGYGIANQTRTHAAGATQQESSLVVHVLPADTIVFANGRKIAQKIDANGVVVPMGDQPLVLEFQRNGVTQLRQVFEPGASGMHQLSIDLTKLEVQSKPRRTGKGQKRFRTKQ